MGGATALADHAWRLLQLAIEKARSALDGPLFCFLVQRVGQGEVGGATALADHAWRLLQLAIEKARSALDGPLFCFLCTNGRSKRSFHLVGAPFLAF